MKYVCRTLSLSRVRDISDVDGKRFLRLESGRWRGLTPNS
jgi:hypothetical protein